MVDPEDLSFSEYRRQLLIERLCTGEIMAKRFFDDHFRLLRSLRVACRQATRS